MPRESERGVEAMSGPAARARPQSIGTAAHRRLGRAARAQMPKRSARRAVDGQHGTPCAPSGKPVPSRDRLAASNGRWH
jgi:hypothetical protein